MPFFKKPYNLLLIAALLLLIISFFYLNITLDLSFHDSYYVFPSAYIIWSWIVMLLLYWCVYFIFRRSLWKNGLTWFHVVSTIAVFLFYYLTTFQDFIQVKQGFWWGEAPQNEMIKGYIHTGVMLIFLISQLCFVINIVGGLVKKIKRA